jgi:nucleoside-diphosphate-sugar epimerase
MKKKVLITGCNGVLGKNLVEYLRTIANDKYELILLDVADDSKVPPDCKFYCGDIRKKDDIKQIIEDIDIVVHCASASPSYNEDDIYDIIINGTTNLLEYSFSEKNIERFIYISSTSVYGVPEKSPIYENDQVKPYDPYNKGKIQAEKICSQWRDKGNCICILRPRSFIGPQRLGTFGILYEWASEGRNFPMVGKGKNKYQLLDVNDLCQAIYLSMSVQKENVNDLFNIGAKEFSTIKEDYQAVLDAAGYGKRIICFPAVPMFIALNILEKLKLSPFYKRLYMKLNSNKDALVRNYKWYLANKDISFTKEGPSNNSVWNQGIIKLSKHFF